MSLNYSFAGKSVLITGGASGIGRSLVQKFHDGGATVFTIDKNPEAIQKLREELPNVRAEVVDLVDWEKTQEIVESFGAIDHLVNNAGFMIFQPFMEITKEATKLQLDVLLGALICVTQAVAKGLIAAGRGGSVVNISSIASRAGNKSGCGVYAAAKAGVENLTKTMALELGVHGIRVNCVVPGCVDTPLLHAVGGSVVEDFLNDKMIVKRLIKPEEIADAVMFLLSPLSEMIVGDSLLVDGGLLTN